MLFAKRLAFVLLACSALAHKPTLADDDAQMLTLQKQHKIAGHFEVDAFLYNVSVSDVFVSTPYAAHVSAAYHVFDWLSVEGVLGYAFASGETGLADNIRAESPSIGKGIELPGLWATTWQLGTNLVFAPIYGTLSLWSELQNHFQIYLFLPIMGDGLKRVISDSTSETAARFATGFGAGLRIFAIDKIVLRGEIRQMYGFNPPLTSGAHDVASTTWLQFGIGYLF